MHVETLGDDGAPDMVLLHGGIGTGVYHWGKQAKALTSRMRVHLPDLPGHGRTPAPEGEYTREVLVEAVQDLVERFEQPVHLGGFSMGGHTAMAFVERRPDLVASLVLVGVVIAPHAGLDEWRGRFDPDVLAERFPIWARQLARLHAPLGDDAWRDVCRRDAGGLAVDADLDALAAYDGPVLLVRGDRDPVVDPGHYARLREVWPQADEAVVPGGGHDVQLTRSTLVRPVLEDFTQRVLDGDATRRGDESAA